MSNQNFVEDKWFFASEKEGPVKVKPFYQKIIEFGGQLWLKIQMKC